MVLTTLSLVIIKDLYKAKYSRKELLNQYNDFFSNIFKSCDTYKNENINTIQILKLLPKI